MDGAGIAAGLLLGASAVQLGTAFITCPESAADEGYRATLLGKASERTVITSAISGRPARCIANRFTALGEEAGSAGVPDYPIAYAAGKALNAAAKAAGESGMGLSGPVKVHLWLVRCPPRRWSRNSDPRWSKHSLVEAIRPRSRDR